MKEAPLVSIIITTCRRETDILERAVKSAVSQTYENKEIIIINDHPPYTERIRKLLEGYPDIRFIVNEEKHGVSFVRNLGLGSSNGEYISFLDDDDEWVDDKIKKQVLAADEDTGLVYCEISALKDGNELKTDEDKEYPEGDVYERLLADNFPGGCSAVLFKKSSAVTAGGFDTVLSFGEDYDLWLRIAKTDKVKAVKEKLVRYHIGHESLTGSLERRMEGWEYLLKKHADDYKRYPGSYRQFTSTMVREAAKRGSFGYAVGIWKKYGNTKEFFKGMTMRILGIY